jgi:hypothetical protein
VKPEASIDPSDVKTIFENLPTTTFVGMLWPLSVISKVVFKQRLSWHENMLKLSNRASVSNDVKEIETEIKEGTDMIQVQFDLLP